MIRCLYLLEEKTMRTLSLEASDQEILETVREWVGLLLEERYTDAYEFLYHEESPYGWTPELIAALIQNQGSPEPWESNEVFKVTLLQDQDAIVAPPQYPGARQDVHRYRDYEPEGFVWQLEGGKKTKIFLRDLPALNENLGGYIWFDLPFGDLTATLDFRVVNNHFVFELKDIRVM